MNPIPGLAGGKKLRLGEKISITYHTYTEFGKHILKESHWYLIKAHGEEKLVPQVEEDITEIRWVKDEDLEKYLGNTFPTIRSVFENAKLV